MTGASGVAEPFEVCVFKIDEFYHLEGCALPRAGGGPWGSPRHKNCSAPGSGDAPAASLLSLFIHFIFFTRRLEEEGSLLRGKAAGGAHPSLPPSPASLLPCLVQRHAPDAKSATRARSQERSSPHRRRRGKQTVDPLEIGAVSVGLFLNSVILIFFPLSRWELGVADT